MPKIPFDIETLLAILIAIPFALVALVYVVLLILFAL